MNLYRFALGSLFVSIVNTAAAFQPVEEGLQPLYERLSAIQLELQPLDHQLQASETLPADRAAAYRRYKALDIEQQTLLQDIERAKQLAASPLVNFLGSVP